MKKLMKFVSLALSVASAVTTYMSYRENKKNASNQSGGSIDQHKLGD